MTLPLDFMFNPEVEPRETRSVVTGSWVYLPRHARIPQVDEDAVHVNASVCNPVDSIKSALLPFQEIY